MIFDRTLILYTPNFIYFRMVVYLEPSMTARRSLGQHTKEEAVQPDISWRIEGADDDMS